MIKKIKILMMLGLINIENKASTDLGKPIEIDYLTSTDVRIARGTGEARVPTITSLALAAHENAQGAIDWLAHEKFSYNIIIDLHHKKVDFFTHDHKDFQEAILKIRPRSAGVSVYTDHGFLQRRDINTESVSIGIVANEKDFKDEKTYNFFVASIKSICKQFNINSHKVLSYPVLAIYPDGTYERASIERNYIMNWQKLAEHGLGLWPKKESSKVAIPFSTDGEAIRWVAQGLNKLGMMAAVTESNNHVQLKSAVKAFQKHYLLKTQNGKVNDETVIVLDSLLQQKEAFELELKTIEPLTLEKYRNRKEMEHAKYKKQSKKNKRQRCKQN